MFKKEEERTVRPTKQHKDKKTRVSPYLDVDLFTKISAISKAVDKTPAMVALDVIEYLLNHKDWIAWYQVQNNVTKNSPYRVIAVNGENGKVKYLFPGTDTSKTTIP